MVNTKELQITKFRISQGLLFLAPVITLIVNPWTNYDPISLPKMLVLTTGSFGILAIMIFNFKDVVNSVPRMLLWIVGAFYALMSSTLIFSGSPINQQFWGSFGRNTGFLTYFSLMTLIAALVWLKSSNFYARLSWMLVVTSVPMTAYCLAQISGKDPIPWSEFNTFGTLGNINFLSAFLGMSSIAAVAFAINEKKSILKKLSLAALALVDLVIIYSTGSIQGPIIFVVGVGVLLFISILGLSKFRNLILAIFGLLSLAGGYLVTIALQNKGPLASIIYQPSVVFRGDYIHAGFEMTVKKPFFGVGMDSYGDWYREMRGEISTLRTGPDRVANTAHNIFLDISSNGGILLGATYVILILLALYSGIRVLRTPFRNNVEFKAIFAVWVAYQIQALVSINQIGVGIWGWVFTGALLGISEILKNNGQIEEDGNFKARSKKLRGRPIQASHALIGALGMSIGFTLSAIPLNADMKYRSSSERGDLVKMISASKSLGATEFHRELVLDFAMRNNKISEVKEIATDLVANYPRSFFGWRVLSVATASTEQERQSAFQKVLSLDPFNPTLR
jgi:O-antigen ligase